jgi:hypothetical protein
MIRDVLCNFSLGTSKSHCMQSLICLVESSLIHPIYDEGTRISSYVMPNAFIAAVIGSEKKMGSTRSTMSPATSKK